MDSIQSSENVKVGKEFVCKTLREQLGLRYRRIKKVAFAGNIDRSLVLRRLYAEEMLALLQQHKRIVVIDESWLN